MKVTEKPKVHKKMENLHCKGVNWLHRNRGDPVLLTELGLVTSSAEDVRPTAEPEPLRPPKLSQDNVQVPSSLLLLPPFLTCLKIGLKERLMGLKSLDISSNVAYTLAFIILNPHPESGLMSLTPYVGHLRHNTGQTGHHHNERRLISKYKNFWSHV